MYNSCTVVCTVCVSLDDASRTSGDCFENAYELLNLKTLKFSHLNKIPIFVCIGSVCETTSAHQLLSMLVT